MNRVDTKAEALSTRPTRFVTLSEVARTVPGLTGKSKADFSNGNARFVTYKNVYANPTVDESASDFVVISDSERQNRLRDGDVIFTGSSENVDDVGMSSVVQGEPTEPLYLNSFCFAVRFEEGDLLPEFSKHLFRSELVRRQIRTTANGVTRINISKSRFMKIRIPIPPIAVQRSIARVLDAFSALESDLQHELDARRAQDRAVRPLLAQSARLIALGADQVERTRLGQIATKYVDPVRVQSDELYANLGVRWYGEGVFAREAKVGSEIKAKTLYRVKPRQFIYNRMFVTEGSFGLVTDELALGVVSNEFPSYDLDTSRVLPEWLYLHFQDPVVVAAAAAETTGGTKSRRRWKEEQFEAFKVDLPPLGVQRELVRMSRVMRDLIDSLDEEIQMRRLQYAHYREQLLSFAGAAA